MAALSVATVSVALLFVPQLNLLNYYFSLAIGLVLPLAAGLVAARSDRGWRDTIVETLVLASIPVAIVSIGAIWVRNCDWLAGLWRYALGPGIGACYGVAVGRFCNALFPRRAGLVVGLWWLGCAAFNLVHIYLHPQIFAYNPFVGYVAGAVYDDYIPVSTTWLLYRLHTLGQIGLLVALSTRRWALAIPFAVSFVLFTAFRGPVGYEITRERIIEELGGTVETAHFVIHYDASSEDLSDRIDALADDHEFRYRQLRELLKIEPDAKITSFVYGSRDQKARLMGAGKTYIAKPWTREVHLNAIEVGAPVLKHELAHVFGAEWAGGLFDIPMQYVVLPRMAMVEGFAVGLTWNSGRLTPHQWSAAMIELGFAAPMERILDATGFLAAHAGQAYTLSGSFLRWLLDTRGVEKFATLYSTGDIETAYGRPPAEMVAEWKAFLADRDQVPLSDDDLKLAEYRFDAPSKFHRVCALETAAWTRAANAARRERDFQTALELTEKVLSFEPDNPGKRLQHVAALLAADKRQEALDAARAVADDERAGAVLRLRARMKAGDVLWLEGRLDEARTTFEALADEPLDEAGTRRVLVSAMAIGWTDPQVRDGVRDYLMSRGAAADDSRSAIEAVAERAPDNPVVRYLLARRLYADEDWKAAAAAHEQALRGGLPPKLARAGHEQLGRTYLELRQLDWASEHFGKARDLHTSAGRRYELQDWIDRARFFGLANRT